MSEKKLVGRNIAVALGIVCIVLIARVFAGGTVAVLGFRGKLGARTIFGDHTGLGGVIIQMLGII